MDLKNQRRLGNLVWAERVHSVPRTVEAGGEGQSYWAAETMSDEDKKKDGEKDSKSFWSSAQGILTGFAAVITAIAGLIVALSTAGVLESSAAPTATTSVALTTPTPIPVTATNTPILPTFTATATQTPTGTPTPTSTHIPTETPTSTSTATNTPTATQVPAQETPTPTSTPAPAPTPTPEPDLSGKLAVPLTYGLYSKVYITGLDGKGINDPEDPVSLDARHPMFSRDGKSLIVNGTAGKTLGVFITDTKGCSPQVLIDVSSAYWPVFSPDGSQIMYAEMALDYKLQRKEIDGEGWEVRANNRPILARNVLWSEDNRLIFQGCQTWLERASKCGIWVTDADNINPVRLIKGLDGWPMDARNGLLAYMSAEDGDWDIYVISLDGGKPRNLTNNMVQDGLAAIAPDGRSVAYISNESGQWALWTVTLDSQEKRLWFVINPERGTIDVTSWAGERMSWTTQ